MVMSVLSEPNMKFLLTIILSFFINSAFSSEQFNWQPIYQYKPSMIDSSSMVSYIINDHSLFISENTKLHKIGLNTGEMTSFSLNTDFNSNPQLTKTPKAGFYYMDSIDNKLLFISYTDKKGIHIWDTSLTTLIELKDNHCGERYPYRISADSQLLSCGSDLYLFATGEPLLKHEARLVHNSGFSTNKYFFYHVRKTNSETASIAFFDIENRENHNLTLPDDVTYAHLSINDNVLAVATEGGWLSKDKLYVYSLPNIHATIIDEISTEGLIVSKDGQYILNSNQSGVTIYKNSAEKFVKHEQLAIKLPVDGASISHEKSGYTSMIFVTENRVLFLTKAGDLQLWDIEQAKMLNSMKVNNIEKVATHFSYQKENNYVVIQWNDDSLDAYKVEVE